MLKKLAIQQLVLDRCTQANCISEKQELQKNEISDGGIQVEDILHVYISRDPVELKEWPKSTEIQYSLQNWLT